MYSGVGAVFAMAAMVEPKPLRWIGETWGMGTELTLEEHLRGFRAAVERGAAAARAAGPDAKVPTCPAWTVRDLMAHIGMVNRWAAAHLQRRGDEVGSGAELTREGKAAPDPVAWWEEGAAALEQTIRAAPEDVKAMVFLKDAPPPRRFWTRRQCHETTIHAADALAAQLGRMPAAVESGIDETIAIDGIDELLTGFLTRNSSKLRVDEARTLAVRPDGDVSSWTMALSTDPPVTRRHAPGEEPVADLTLSGSAVAIYLALWNRGDEITGDADTMAWWRKTARVRWS
jgi:uncharacterized protein (TIGR03083 family)